MRRECTPTHADHTLDTVAYEGVAGRFQLHPALVVRLIDLYVIEHTKVPSHAERRISYLGDAAGVGVTGREHVVGACGDQNMKRDDRGPA